MLESTEKRTTNYILPADEALTKVSSIDNVSCTHLETEEEKSEELYEVSNRRRVVAFDRPIQSAFSTLALSKLHMLKFIAWLQQCLDPTTYSLCLSDTDR